ncbi:hypothetical protein, partial [Acinetobacter baumannii]|uniref:hypothetical protein n=1 Tax=Acinetobacter baumannii TaxID=470 RepID=UPI0031CE0E59
ILSLRQVGHLISRVIRISLFYQNSTCFVSAYFLKHHPKCLMKTNIKKRKIAIIKIVAILFSKQCSSLFMRTP